MQEFLHALRAHPLCNYSVGRGNLEGVAGVLPHALKSLASPSLPREDGVGAPPLRACKNSVTRLGEHKLLLVVEEKPEYVVPVRTTSFFDASEIHS